MEPTAHRRRHRSCPRGLLAGLLVLAGCSNNASEPLPACGDGVLDDGELCDPGIADGEPGACPAACDDGEAPTIDVLRGTPETCTAECLFVRIPACGAADGFCPPCCTAAADADCGPSAHCGDGVVDAGETCDLTCPTTCDDGDACTDDVMAGSSDTCDVVCAHQAISACVAGDGCCPDGCDHASDADCPPPQPDCTSNAQCTNPAAPVCGGSGTCVGCQQHSDCALFPSQPVCDTSTGACVPAYANGEACTDAIECAGGICTIYWPGGYCTEACGLTAALDCPAGGHCVVQGGLGPTCMADCSPTSAPCRTDYTCGDADMDGVYECYPPVTP